MKNKKVYVSPNVKGVYVLESNQYQDDSSVKDDKKNKGIVNREEEKGKTIKEFKAVQEEAYRNGKLDAEVNCEQELKEINNRYASLIAMFQDAVQQLIDKRERIWQESESDIIKLILAIVSKVVGYEVSNNSINVVRHVIRDAFSYMREKKIVAIRISVEDAKKMNELNDVKMVDQNIKFVEDKAISSGGCIIDTNFGSVDSCIETRWEEIVKNLSENKNESTKN